MEDTEEQPRQETNPQNPAAPALGAAEGGRKAKDAPHTGPRKRAEERANPVAVPKEEIPEEDTPGRTARDVAREDSLARTPAGMRSTMRGPILAPPMVETRTLTRRPRVRGTLKGNEAVWTTETRPASPGP